MSQNIWSGDIYLNPHLQRVGHSHITGGGLDLLDFVEKKDWQPEIGVRLSRKLFRNINTGIGLSIKGMHYGFTTHIPDPLDESIELKAIGGEIRMLMCVPSLFIEFKVKRFNVLAGVEINLPLYKSSTFEETDEFIGIFEPPDRFGGVFIYVPPSFTDVWAQFIMPDICVAYEILPPRLSIHAGVKLKAYGYRPLYAIRVDGFGPGLPTEDVYLLEATIVNSKAIMPYLGVNDSFTLGAHL